jgi:hypothetical protein
MVHLKFKYNFTSIVMLDSSVGYSVPVDLNVKVRYLRGIRYF